MKKTIGYLLFWIGDRICRLAMRYDSVFLFEIYQRLMVWSDWVDPWPESKPPTLTLLEDGDPEGLWENFNLQVGDTIWDGVAVVVVTGVNSKWENMQGITLNNGGKILLRATDPNQWWAIHETDHTVLFKGKHDSLRNALAAIRIAIAYREEKGLEVNEVPKRMRLAIDPSLDPDKKSRFLKSTQE